MNVNHSFTAFFDDYPGGMIGRAAAVAPRLFEGLGDSLPQTALGRSPCELHWRRAVDEWPGGRVLPILLPGSWHLHPSVGFIPPHRPSGLIYHTVTPRVDNEKGRPGNVGKCGATDRVRVIGVNSVWMVWS